MGVSVSCGEEERVPSTHGQSFEVVREHGYEMGVLATSRVPASLLGVPMSVCPSDRVIPGRTWKTPFFRSSLTAMEVNRLSTSWNLRSHDWPEIRTLVVCLANGYAFEVYC